MLQSSIEQKARRALRKEGYQLRKSRARNMSLDNFLGYMIVDISTNCIVAGSHYELSLEDVMDFVNS